MEPAVSRGHKVEVDGRIDFLIITALEEERDALLDRLPNVQRLPATTNDLRIYYRSDLSVSLPNGKQGCYRVVVLCLPSMGRVEAATATSDAIRRWNPCFLLLVGIAGGIREKKIRLGDLIISTQIVDYELQRLKPGEPEIRYEVYRADPRLLNIAKSIPDEDWAVLIKAKSPIKRQPRRHCGPIATGDKVVGIAEFLRSKCSHWPELLGVEMEAGGSANAAFQSTSQPGFFMIRGVSDLADRHKNSSSVKRWRHYACDVAASFTVALLQSGLVPICTDYIKTGSIDSISTLDESDEAKAYNQESEAITKVEQMRRLGEWHTKEEINKTARRKYIPELYIHRRTEAVLDEVLPTDKKLSQELYRLSDEITAMVSNTLDPLHVKLNEYKKLRKKLKRDLSAMESTYQQLHKESNTMNEKLEETARWISTTRTELGEIAFSMRKHKLKIARLGRLRNNIDMEIMDILADNRPCDVKNRMRFASFAQLLDKLRNFVSKKSADRLQSASKLARCCSSYITVLVDRAGGGKTNLLCHEAIQRSKEEPTLFLSGRITVEHPEDLLAVVLTRLGIENHTPTVDPLQELNRLLTIARSHITIFLDGINENRNIVELNAALDHIVEKFSHIRARIVIACRDIYWTFFENSNWASKTGIPVKRSLYEFSSTEHKSAIKVYFRHFKIHADLGSEAWECCKHPLLLRFFCEAYASPTNHYIDLGYVADIRLKPLFDDYWKKKFSQLLEIAGQHTTQSPEHSISAIGRHMFESNSASVTTADFSAVTGVHDLSTTESLYLRLLDEDIIIEEVPSTKGHMRRIVFVYEEFMEYTIARELFHRCILSGTETVDQLFSEFNKKTSTFVNTLGVVEYICAFCLDHHLYQKAFNFFFLTAKTGGVWKEITVNVFSKNYRALDMILSADPAFLYSHLDDIEVLLSTLGVISRRVLIDVCAALSFRIILPQLVCLKDLKSGILPPFRADFRKSMLDTDVTEAEELLSIIARAMLKFDRSSLRLGVWKDMAHRRKSLRKVYTRNIIRRLGDILRDSPAKELLLLYACNGLFSQDVSTRIAAAFITLNITSKTVKDMHRIAYNIESDEDVKIILGKNASKTLQR